MNRTATCKHHEWTVYEDIFDQAGKLVERIWYCSNCGESLHVSLKESIALPALEAVLPHLEAAIREQVAMYEPGKQPRPLPVEPVQVALRGGRKVGKTTALIESILEHGEQRGIEITVHHPLPDREQIADALRSNILGASAFALDVRLEMADAVLELLRGETG